MSDSIGLLLNLINALLTHCLANFFCIFNQSSMIFVCFSGFNGLGNSDFGLPGFDDEEEDDDNDDTGK